MGSFKISSLSPIRFHQAGRGDFVYNLIPSFEHERGYCQKYFHGDIPYIQVIAGAAASITMQMINNAGTVFASWSVGDSGVLLCGEKVYHWDGSIPDASTTPEGVYFLKMSISDSEGNTILYSEPLFITASYSNTVAIIYTHDENDFDRKFTGDAVLPSMLRIEGGMKSDGFAPGGKFKMFQDIDYNTEILNSSPLDVEKWTFGPSEGAPNHIGGLLNRIFGLSNVTIDGVQYSRNEGAKLERAGDSDYPLAGWAIELVKSDNPYSETFQTSFNELTCDNIIVTCDTELISCDAETF